MRLLHLLVLWPAALSWCAPFRDDYPAYGRQIDNEKVVNHLVQKYGWGAAAGGLLGLFMDPRSTQEKAADRATRRAARAQAARAAYEKANPPKPEVKPEPYKVKPDTPIEVHEKNLDSQGKDEIGQCQLEMLTRYNNFIRKRPGEPLMQFTESEKIFFTRIQLMNLNSQQILSMFHDQCLNWHKAKGLGIVHRNPVDAGGVLAPIPPTEEKDKQKVAATTDGGKQLVSNINAMASSVGQNAAGFVNGMVRAAPGAVRAMQPAMRQLGPQLVRAVL